MGCCFSAPKQADDDHRHHDAPDTNVNPPHHPQSLAPSRQTEPSETQAEGTTPLRQYTLAELVAATHGFSLQNMLSKGGGKFPNMVFSGHLPGPQEIVVKRFSMVAWPDAEEFKKEVIKAGRLRHHRLVNLIGYCCDEDERLLVAEFMPNDTLATRLFSPTNKTLEWSMRVRVASYVAEALEYCINEGQALYFDLNSYKVLFNEADFPCLSGFGLVKSQRNGNCYSIHTAYIPPECMNGMKTPESVIFSFGVLLRDLLSGKETPQNKAIHMILGRNVPVVVDSRLNGEYPIEEEIALAGLANQCLRYEPKDRPTIKDVIATLAQVQSNAAGEAQ
ncbi:serine/threonine-protein kinase BSK1-like [Dioscorea cayenensis subsp. rotundata]|uniref:Serine/threonine-protein kinase BSK1-like n=1 Tax=Dioscorea cayennensis subsp. rotundata TaxID=55577 RepID=A0AB40CAX6_DIOCR|nr:serine/threonine-protein kinase BSK1-like [Dioscorea cayenensis subsp. rotundata]